MLLSLLLGKLVQKGTLTVVGANGKSRTFGDGHEPEVTVRLHKRSLETKLFLNPCLYLGEAYMDGTLTIEQGTMMEFLCIVTKNLSEAESLPLYHTYDKICRMLRFLQQYNPVGRSKDNVAHHYDISNKLYRMFLDDDLQYSCAYFKNPDDDLETAQTNKKLHIASKLLLEPGQRILDIGSGWGGMALFLANAGAGHVTGLTLSEEQLRMSRKRAADTGMEKAVDFKLLDYRLQTGKFDRIVSVGMFEHVGVHHYREFFTKVRELLTDDGVCLLHSIGRKDGPSSTCAWIRKYIFPGGYSPSLSEVLAATEDCGLWVTDIEILRLHYAKTLNNWQARFQANRDKVRDMFDERFCRMWEFYLGLSEAAFVYGDHLVFQMQIAKKRDAVPLTRDYQFDWEGQAEQNMDKGLSPLQVSKAGGKGKEHAA